MFTILVLERLRQEDQVLRVMFGYIDSFGQPGLCQEKKSGEKRKERKEGKRGRKGKESNSN